jgi:2,4'-dihydroxyacetophenone dioxygenase
VIIPAADLPGLRRPSHLGEQRISIVPDDVQGMTTLFHVTGGYTYIDPYGVALGYEDVFTKLEQASRHYESAGLGKDYVRRLVR